MNVCYQTQLSCSGLIEEISGGDFASHHPVNLGNFCVFIYRVLPDRRLTQEIFSDLHFLFASTRIKWYPGIANHHLNKAGRSCKTPQHSALPVSKPKMARVLIACEFSGIVRDAFRARGHDAWSCDLRPTRKPGSHYHGDIRDIIDDQWDLMIAHPVCRTMANSGVRWLHERPERWDELDKGCEFFNLFRDAVHIPRRCIENSIMHKYAIERIGRRQDQVVQPWWFGDPFTKAAALWLYGLPKLTRKHRKDNYSRIEPKCWKLPPSPEREELRSTTEPGFAMAMADQWGGLLNTKAG